MTQYRLSLLFLCIVPFITVAKTGLGFEKKTLGSVVSVLPEWKQNTARPEAPEGTGIAILKGGYLMTNAHVLGNAENVDIRLNTGRRISVEIVGRDLKTDLALLKAPMDFPLLQPADKPELASRVCTISNQFGLGLSVTCGVISAIHRTATGFNIIEDFIQTDATINPGGSGGALVNADGALVGMISAIFTKGSDANIGINFATSTELLLRVAVDLRDHGRVLWGTPGFTVRALDTEELKNRTGTMVIRVLQGGDADIAGLKAGDIITQVGDRDIQKPADLTSAISLYRPGESVILNFFRGNQSQSANVILTQ